MRNLRYAVAELVPPCEARLSPEARSREWSKQMTISDVGRYLLSICAAVTLLSSCGALPSDVAQGRLAQDGTQPPVLPEAQSKVKVLYNFTGGSDGGGPALFAVLAMDEDSNLYGAAAAGTGTGCNGPCGVVFKMTRGANGKWKESVLFDFTGYHVDGEPVTSLALDGKGNLYGGAIGGKQGYNALIYQLMPGTGGWNFNVIED